MSPSLYHYTCDHGRKGIGDRGYLVVPRDLKNAHGGPQSLHGVYAELDGLIWMTDLDVPHRHGLGLRSTVISCDRIEHRYRVLTATDTRRYINMRRSLNPMLARLLEEAPGAMPMHWWVASAPIPVAYDASTPSSLESLPPGGEENAHPGPSRRDGDQAAGTGCALNVP